MERMFLGSWRSWWLKHHQIIRATVGHSLPHGYPHRVAASGSGPKAWEDKQGRSGALWSSKLGGRRSSRDEHWDECTLEVLIGDDPSVCHAFRTIQHQRTFQMESSAFDNCCALVSFLCGELLGGSSCGPRQGSQQAKSERGKVSVRLQHHGCRLPNRHQYTRRCSRKSVRTRRCQQSQSPSYLSCGRGTRSHTLPFIALSECRLCAKFRSPRATWLASPLSTPMLCDTCRKS